MPLIRIWSIDIFSDEMAQALPLAHVIKIAPEQLAFAVQESTRDWSVLTFQLCLTVYLLGVLVISYRLALGMYDIIKMYQHGHVKHHDGYSLVYSQQDHLPFSFFHLVFISESTHQEQHIQQIMDHELTHVRSRHSWDVLFMELMTIIFWFHPMIYVYKTAVRQTHEYLADNIALASTSQKIYGHILVKQSISGFQIALTNQFFQSHLKKRINMMYQKKSDRLALLRYALAVPVLFLLVVSFTTSEDLSERNGVAGHISSISPSDRDSIPKVNVSFSDVEQMPRYGGATSDHQSSERLIEHLLSNIDHPDMDKIDGRVEASFVIKSDGSVGSIYIDGNIEEKARNSFIQALESTVNQWTPGRHQNQAVSVLMSLPIIFTLVEEERVSDKETEVQDSEGDEYDIIRETQKIERHDKDDTDHPYLTIYLNDPVKVEYSDGRHQEGSSNLKQLEERGELKGLRIISKGQDLTTSPLIVIDGVIKGRDLNKLAFNPRNINTLSVLKDELATAKYGPEGRHDVIEITVKNSSEGSHPRSSFDTIIIFDPDTYIETIMIREVMYEEEEVMPGERADLVMRYDTIITFDPDTYEETFMIQEVMYEEEEVRLQEEEIEADIVVTTEYDADVIIEDQETFSDDSDSEYDTEHEVILLADQVVIEFADEDHDVDIQETEHQEITMKLIGNVKIVDSDRDIEAQSIRYKQNTGMKFTGFIANLGHPLFVIDGEVIDKEELQQIEALLALTPWDIESIDILKGKSALALYPEKGENGVVLVTTKRKGKTAKKIRKERRKANLGNKEKQEENAAAQKNLKKKAKTNKDKEDLIKSQTLGIKIVHGNAQRIDYEIKSSSSLPAEISLFDSSGRLVSSQIHKVTDNGIVAGSFDDIDLMSGIYVVRCMQGNQLQSITTSIVE